MENSNLKSFDTDCINILYHKDLQYYLWHLIYRYCFTRFRIALKHCFGLIRQTKGNKSRKIIPPIVFRGNIMTTIPLLRLIKRGQCKVVLGKAAFWKYLTTWIFGWAQNTSQNIHTNDKSPKSMQKSRRYHTCLLVVWPLVGKSGPCMYKCVPIVLSIHSG